MARACTPARLLPVAKDRDANVVLVGDTANSQLRRRRLVRLHRETTAPAPQGPAYPAPSARVIGEHVCPGTTT